MKSDKNPGHPSALRLRDVHAGIEVTSWQPLSGQVNGRFLSEPYIKEVDGVPRLVVRIIEDGQITELSLFSLGIVPNKNGTWHDGYVVHRKHANKLPKG